MEPDRAWVDGLRAALPELPAARRARFAADYGLEPATVRILTGDRAWGGFFEAAVELGADPRGAANWMTGDLAGLLNEAHEDLESSKVTPGHLAELVALVGDGTISTAGGKAALAEAFSSGDAIGAIVEAKGLRQVSDATGSSWRSSTGSSRRTPRRSSSSGAARRA